MGVVMETMEAEVSEARAVPKPAPAYESMTAVAASTVTVDIYDQTYHLRGQDPAYIAALAELVDSKMRAVASGGTTVDSLRVAVLAALNIADELMRIQSRYRELSGSIHETENSLRDRAASLSGLLDSILADDRRVG
jgi:cell division protein ZapA